MKKNKISKNWVNKQRRDIYVRQSKVDGYRARSAYKLIEIDEKFKIFKGGLSVIDIGAAPGSWSQYASKVIKPGKVVAIDLKEIESIKNTIQIKGDFTDPNIQKEIKNFLNKDLDVVMSDMAVNTTGIKNLDAIQTGIPLVILAALPRCRYVCRRDHSPFITIPDARYRDPSRIRL